MSTSNTFGKLVLAAAFAASLSGIPSASRAADPEEALRVLVQDETGQLPGRVEITVGALDDRVKLAPCAKPEPFVPNGTRLWGRVKLGVRCREGASWSVLVPVHIRVFAPALVATRALTVGNAITEDDYRMEEVELTREPPGILTDSAPLASQLVARAVAAGAPLRRDHFRPRPVVAPGDQVRLVYAGAGFMVSSFGRALHAGLDGQPVRVQVDSGRIVSGIARPGRTVEVAF